MSESRERQSRVARRVGQRSSVLDELRVLLVEDDRELREFFAMMLTADGADVAHAESGCEAMAAVRCRPFDAIITDLGLPDLRGDLLIPHLRALATEPPAVVVISGYGEPFLTMALAAGADAAFAKPVEWDRVVAFLLRVKLRGSG